MNNDDTARKLFDNYKTLDYYERKFLYVANTQGFLLEARMSEELGLVEGQAFYKIIWDNVVRRIWEWACFDNRFAPSEITAIDAFYYLLDSYPIVKNVLKRCENSKIVFESFPTEEQKKILSDWVVEESFNGKTIEETRKEWYPKQTEK